MNRGKLLGYLEERFGIDRSVFDGICMHELAKGRMFAYAETQDDLSMNALNRGLPFARIGTNGAIKPTTVMIQVFGGVAKRNVVQLNADQTKSFINAEQIDIAPQENVSDGYVIARHKNISLGCGQLSGNSLRSMVPKAKRIDVKLL